MFNDAGFIRRVMTVEANVAEWDARNRKLSLMNLTDQNPLQMDRETGNVDINNFNTVLVVSESGAAWTSVSSRATPKPFDDAADIQEEFNEIKIYDPVDSAPFGFY